MAPDDRLRGSLFPAPAGQITEWRVQPRSQKYFHFLPTQITGISFPVPPLLEGRFAIVTDVGGGMRWTRMAL
jgi:hypothetical protein